MGGGPGVDVLFDVRHINQSGIGTYIATELPYLQDTVAKFGLSMAVLANSASQPPVRDTTQIVLADPGNAAMYTLQEQKAWAHALKATRPRAFWVPHYPYPLALLAPANRATKCFVTVHDTLHIMPRRINAQPLPKRMYARAMLTLDARRATTIFTPSHATAKTLLDARPSARVVVSPLGLDEIWFSPVDPALSPVDGRYIVYVGNAKWHKNLTVLIEAFEQVLTSTPHKLVIAGGGESVRTVDSRVDELAARSLDRVAISGRLEFAALRALVAGADLLVMPSLHEGVGLPPLEAMALHTAVLASRIPALVETCGDGAEYFDPYDPRELADLIRKYCCDDQARAELAARGFAHVTRRQSRIALSATSEAICAELGKLRRARVKLVSDSAVNQAPPRIGVAVTTLGRWDALRGLLDDMARQSQPPHAVAIAHHDAGAEDDLDALVRSFANKLTIFTGVSPRGISNGRNAAAAMLGDDVDWLWFPNDNTRVDDDFLERVALHLTPNVTACAMQLADRGGYRNVLPPPGSPVTRRNIWGAIEAATMFRRQDFVRAGRFDPGIGTGAETPWQAGEGTDLLLRMSTLDGFSIEWVPDIVVGAQTEFTHLPTAERRRKLRCYGRGTGYVYRCRDYSGWQRFRHVVGAALMPLRQPDKFHLRDGLALAVGRAEGVLGRVIPGNQDNRAALR